MSAIIHETKPHVNVTTVMNSVAKRTLRRQQGNRNVFFGQKKRLWNNYIQTRRNTPTQRNASNVSNNNLMNVRPINTSGPEWAIHVGDTAAESVPSNLYKRRNRTVKRPRRKE